MKKLTFLFALTLSLGVKAQDINNGEKINFKNSSDGFDGTSLYRNSSNNMRFEFNDHFDFKSLNEGYIKIRNANKISIKLNPHGDSYFDDGNIGFGTKSPEELLHLKRNNATIKLSSGQYHQTEGTVISKIKFNNHNTGNTSLDYSSEIRGILSGSSAQLVGMQFLTLGSVRMHIDHGGNVGIGTTDPGNKLEVNGTIRSKEILVEASPWPDYVFEADYELQSLEETANYIEKNHHLPGVPSASEVETNGVALGEMNALLLKKIEELTLHLIEKNEEIVEMKKDIRELKNQLK